MQILEEKTARDSELKDLQAALDLAVRDRDREEGQKQAAEQHVISNATEIQRLREQIAHEEVKQTVAQQ